MFQEEIRAEACWSDGQDGGGDLPLTAMHMTRFDVISLEQGASRAAEQAPRRRHDGIQVDPRVVVQLDLVDGPRCCNTRSDAVPAMTGAVWQTSAAPAHTHTSAWPDVSEQADALSLATLERCAGAPNVDGVCEPELVAVVAGNGRLARAGGGPTRGRRRAVARCVPRQRGQCFPS